MADKGLEVLEQYDFNVEQTIRGRGMVIVHTDKGLRILKKYSGSGRHIHWIVPVLDKLSSMGAVNVDAYVPNKNGEYISTADDGTRYIVKRWYDCRDCDIKSVKDVTGAVNALATLHNQLEKIELTDNLYEGPDIRQDMVRHNNEIFRVKKYLSKRNNRNSFEQMALKCCDVFYAEGAATIDGLSENSNASGACRGLCHGNYNYHNVCFGTGAPVIINFEKMNVNYQMADLYNIIRKLMEKYDWDIKLGYLLIGEYDRMRRLDVSDIEMLSYMLSYPEKFWKIMNAYYNSGKSWIPAKNCDKLKTIIGQNEKRIQFIRTLR